MLWQDDAMFRTYAVAESPLLSRPDKPERTTPYYDRRHYGGRQHYVHGAAMAIPVVTMVSLLIVTACSAPQRLQVQQASGCDANGNIYLAIDPRPTTWNPDYLFAITVGFGAYDYMTAKIIDVIWDVLVSRCGQVVAGMLVYRVFRKVMLLRMEDGPEPYEMFANVANRTTSIEALVTYVRQWGVWDAKAWVRPRSQQWRWRWAFAAVALTYTTAYTLALPTVASAMTGYQTNNVAMMFLENGSSVEVSQITMYAGVIRDASRIGYLDPYIPLTGELNYAIRNYTSGCNLQQHCDEANATQYYYYSTVSLTYVRQNLTAPPLQIDFCKTQFHHDYYNNNGECYGSYQGSYWNTTYIRSSSRCVPQTSYQWGFSLQLLTLFMIATTAFAVCLYIMWLDTYWHTHPSKGKFTFGTLKAAMEISASIRRDVGDEAEDMTDKELRQRLQELKGGVTLRADERSLHKVEQHAEEENGYQRYRHETKQYWKRHPGGVLRKPAPYHVASTMGLLLKDLPKLSEDT